MKGSMLSIKPDGSCTTRHFDEAPDLDVLKKAIGGGWLEKVPGFEMIDIEGDVMWCVALCDEDGKNKNLPTNHTATAMWHVALIAGGHPLGLRTPAGTVADYLCGEVVILFGDEEFMDAL